MLLVTLALLIYMWVKKQRSKHTKAKKYYNYHVLTVYSMNVSCTERKPVYLESNEAYGFVERNQREEVPTNQQNPADSALYEHIITTESNVCYETVPVHMHGNN